MESKYFNFAFYCTAFVLYGSMITAMGPVIPFFSEATGEPQTYYSFIFLWRAAGYVAGGTLVKLLVEKFSVHQILVGSLIVGGLAFMASTYSLSFWNLSITIFIGSGCCCILNVSCNIATIQIFPERQDFWIQLLHMMFGVGGFIGPFAVAIFNLKSYFFLGLLLMICSALFLIFPSPENRSSRRTSVVTMERPISRQVEVIICLLYLLYIGMQVGYGSWVSSYAVMKGVSNAEEATFASSVFWISNTVFRVILIFWTSKISLRLKVLLGGMVVGCTVNLIACLGGHHWFASHIGSFLNGMFLACLFALYISLPSEFDFKVTKRNTANFMMCSTLGEGVLSMPIGYGMGVFGAELLFFTEFSLAIGSFLLMIRGVQILERDSKANYLNPKKVAYDESDNGSENIQPY